MYFIPSVNIYWLLLVFVFGCSVCIDYLPGFNLESSTRTVDSTSTSTVSTFAIRSGPTKLCRSFCC